MEPGRRAPRTVTAVLTVTLMMWSSLACGTGQANYDLGPPARPGQPAGTAVTVSSADTAGLVRQLQDAITTGGGTVTAVVDHTADARGAGVDVPASTVVIGGTPAARSPLLRVDQRAGVTVPERYLVREGPSGTATVTYDGADYVAAVSGVAAPAASTALATEITRVVGAATGAVTLPLAAPLIGVTPTGYLLAVGGDASFTASLTRLRTNARRAPSRVVAELDLVPGTESPGPQIRPTTEVLVSNTALEAPLIAAAPTFGLEMPMRYLVWVDADNRTQVGYPDVRVLAARHGLATTDPNVVRLAAEADRLARPAALGSAA